MQRKKALATPFSAAVNASGGVCKFYLTGKCKFGRRCRNLHPPLSSPSIRFLCYSKRVEDTTYEMWSSDGARFFDSPVSKEFHHDYYPGHFIYQQSHIEVARKCYRQNWKALAAFLCLRCSYPEEIARYISRMMIVSPYLPCITHLDDLVEFGPAEDEDWQEAAGRWDGYRREVFERIQPWTSDLAKIPILR